PGELQIASQVVQIVGQDNTASHERKELHTACDCCHLFITHGRITGAEIHRTSHKLLDTLTTPNGFIAELHVWMLFLVFLQPFFIEGCRKGRARAVQLECPNSRTLSGSVVTRGKATATDCQGQEHYGTTTRHHGCVSSHTSAKLAANVLSGILLRGVFKQLLGATVFHQVARAPPA